MHQQRTQYEDPLRFFCACCDCRYHLKLSVTEWCICLTLFGLVMALELVNTSIEAVVDLVTEERKPLAKIAKDTAAGAVLIAAIMAAIIGCIIFVPKGLAFIGAL